MNITTFEEKQQTMSSREIAELTGKAHGHVKRDIEKMLNDLELSPSKFGHIYFDSRNQMIYQRAKKSHAMEMKLFI